MEQLFQEVKMHFHAEHTLFFENKTNVAIIVCLVFNFWDLFANTLSVPHTLCGELDSELCYWGFPT